MKAEKLTGLEIENFTAFENIRLNFSPGLNVFIGENSTGKTHALKLLYCAATVDSTNDFDHLIIKNFLPVGDAIGRLVRRSKVSTMARVQVFSTSGVLQTSFSNHSKPGRAKPTVSKSNWTPNPSTTVFIPVRESLAQAPGFRSLYTHREIHVEKSQYDLIDKCFLPVTKGNPSKHTKDLLDSIEKAVDGKVIHKEETFYLKNKAGELEFTLLSEGLRKLALLSILAQNEVLSKGSILFWDEPEANLNPNRMEFLATLLRKLVLQGVQIFICTHNYVLLKELELQSKTSDDFNVRYFSFHRDGEASTIQVENAEQLSDLTYNPILSSYLDLTDRELDVAMGNT